MSAVARGRACLRHLAVARDELLWVAESFPAEFALWRPSPAAWSAHQTLTHLRDTEAHAYARRVELVLTTDEPELPDFPGGEWMARWSPEGTLVELVLAYVSASRGSTDRLEDADEATWRRRGTHPTFGRLSLVGWTERMYFHLVDHLAQVLSVRAALRAEGLLIE